MKPLQKKIAAAAGGIVIAGLAAYWYWSPYVALHQMRNAAIEADADSFNDHVDYPKLRESLKGQISARITGELSNLNQSSNAFERAGSAFGSMLGLALVDKIVDALVQPENVMQAMKNGKFKPGRGQQTMEAKEQAAQLDILTLSQAVKLYKLDHGSYPTQQQGLAILLDQAANEGRTYLEKLPTDPWGRPYQYANPGKGSSGFEITYLPPPAKDDGSKPQPTAWHTERKGMDKIFLYVTAAGVEPKASDASFVMRRKGFADWQLTEIRLAK